MEPLFECHYVRDESVMKDYLRRTLLLSPFAIALYAITGYYLYQGIELWFAFGQFYPTYMILVALLPGFIYYSYRRNLKLMVARELEQNNGQPLELHCTITRDALTLSGPFGSQENSFDVIKKVRTTKKLILLYTNARLVWIIPRDSFVHGDPTEFLAFLKDKGLKVR